MYLKNRLPDIDFTDLADTPDSLGTAGQIAAVNSQRMELSL